MPNMSYCRWENTASALFDCARAQEDLDFDFEKLSSPEQQGHDECLSAAVRLLKNANQDRLAELDRFDLNELAAVISEFAA